MSSAYFFHLQGLSLLQKGPCLYRCSLQLPEVSVVSEIFKRKKDAMQSAAEKDIEKPLHVGFTSDRGGNTINVHWYTRKAVLHHVWDDNIIETAEERFYDSNVDGLIDAIQTNIMKEWADQVQTWENCSRNKATCPDIYASEGIKAACDWAYKGASEGSVLEDDYFLSRLPIVNRRLAQGGVRLAATLNRIFGREEHENCDPQPRYVRSRIESGGFNISLMKPRNGRPRTQVQHLMQIDLKGYKREEVKIQVWENYEKRKAEMEMKKIEVNGERLKFRAQERYSNKLASTKRIAEENEILREKLTTVELAQEVANILILWIVWYIL